jgi:hypothetical protein
MRSALAGFLIVIACTCAAQEEKGVRITFLPPPLEGTLSAGVFTVDGRLARMLASEATEKDFTVGLNGFITNWDGRDNAGKPLAPGKYFVRGYAVGDVQTEGVAFHGNDFVANEDAPHIASLTALNLEGRVLKVFAKTVDGKGALATLDLESGKWAIGATEEAGIPATKSGAWSIETVGADAEARHVLVQRKGEEVLRELAFATADPQPVALAAAADRDELFLIEHAEKETRLRGLRLKETKAGVNGQAVSEWEVFLTKAIHVQPDFASVAALLGREKPPAAEEKLRVALIPNELLQVAPASLQVSIGSDEKGSFLRSSDGLPLRRITDTPGIKWAVLAREAAGVVTVFQSDGAVIEEFRVRKLDQMMAFDAGSYELK